MPCGQGDPDGCWLNLWELSSRLLNPKHEEIAAVYYFSALTSYREPLNTSVFGGFLTPWRKLHLRNFLYIKELAIFSVEPQ
jgi:hypothetical protein